MGAIHSYAFKSFQVSSSGFCFVAGVARWINHNFPGVKMFAQSQLKLMAPACGL